MATATGRAGGAPDAARAPGGVPADGATSAFAPRAFAMVTARVMPRALNEPVGLRASSFTRTERSTFTSGVHPSESVTASAAETGRPVSYRQSEGRAEGWKARSR